MNNKKEEKWCGKDNKIKGIKQRLKTRELKKKE